MGNEERQTRALESIAKATQEFTRIFETFNRNIVELSRAIQVSEKVESNPDQLTVYEITQEDLDSVREQKKEGD